MQQIKSILIGNPDNIINLISQYGFCNIKSKNKYVTFAFDDMSNGSCMIDINTLNYTRWSNNTHGDIITAIMHKTGMNFKDTVDDIYLKMNIKHDSSYDNIQFNQDCIFKDLLCDIKDIVGQNVYTQYQIDKYKPIISTMFRKDGIDIGTQCDWDIRYDEETDRIVIFWRNIDGDVVGCTARANWVIDKDYHFKYISLLPFNKRQFLFGLDKNKDYIKQSGYCVLVEAEKSTLQAYTFGFRSICSVGMSYISKEQIQLLYDLGIRQVILAYDEDKHIIEYIKRASDIKEWFNDMQVYAIYDKEHEFLEVGSKDSPTDNGKEIFQKLFEKCLIKI